MRFLLIWLLIDAGSLRTDYPPQQQVVTAASQYEWPVVRSLSVAWCESYHKLTAFNGVDNGAWQVNEKYWGSRIFGELWEKRFEAEANAAMAFHIWSVNKNFQWWSCGRYN
tara:strand:+ start:84 stop:416 length:333 start_codon:yes stop_codon:yes gene_type:complete